MITAYLKNYRQSPQKVRLVANSVRGKKVGEVYPVLDLLGKRAAVPMKKLVESAVANAVHNHDAKREDLFIAEVRVDEGPTLKRWRPRARGRAFPIKKRTSHVYLRLESGSDTSK